jgi:hypothetical protein
VIVKTGTATALGAIADCISWPPPAKFYLILALMVVEYLFIVEAAKRYFYCRFSWQPR